MPKEKDQAQKAENAQRAAASGANQSMLRSELAENIEVLRKRAYNAFSESRIDDHEGHRQCRMYLEVLADFEQLMTMRIANGKIAQHELESFGKPN